jgi:cation transporter-like permease
MLFSCGLGLLLLSLSSAVAVLAGFGAGEIVGAESVFVLALLSAGSAVILIVLDLLIALVSMSRQRDPDEAVLQPAGRVRAGRRPSMQHES